MDWIKGKQPSLYQRPRIDWVATLAPFVPFWIVVGVGALAAWGLWG